MVWFATLVAGGVIGYVLSWTMPSVGQFIAGCVTRWSGDIPSLAGTWKNSYEEDDDAGDPTQRTEIIQLRQLGRWIWGVGTVSGNSGQRKFKHRAYISRSMLIGTFRRTDARIGTGKGSYCLRIAASDHDMDGKCLYVNQNDDQRVEVSPYKWRREDRKALRRGD